MAKTASPLLLDISPIRYAELFSSLLEKDLAYVESRTGILQLRSGGRLFSAGEKAERFFILLEGKIRVFRIISDQEEEMAEFSPGGDPIGDFDFARGGRYSACADAVEDSVLVVFPGIGLTMDKLAIEAPGKAAKLYLNFLSKLTSRIKAVQKLIVEESPWVEEQERLAFEDPGTGLWKQAYLAQKINSIMKDNERLAMIMLKPDRFKSLVDSRGHGAGDEAMARIAKVLIQMKRRVGRGWALRFKSNEAGILINKCGAPLGENIALELHKAVGALEPVPASGDIPSFAFSGTVCYSIWPDDEPVWESLFQGTYAMLLDAWRDKGNRVVHFKRGAKK